MVNINSNTFIWLYRRGLICSEAVGGDEASEFMLAYPIDNVQYVFDDAGDLEEEGDPSFLISSIECLSHILERHHSIVKVIYESLQQKFNTKDIWVRIGAGPQLGLMFGYKDGIIGVLSMDFINAEEKQIILDELANLSGVDPSEKDVIIDESNSFYINSLDMNKYFENTDYPEVTIIFYDDYYDEDEDED